ncbi:hypothetical protein BH10PSE3_BH10PSE3_11270 [soil metagenome]
MKALALTGALAMVAIATGSLARVDSAPRAIVFQPAKATDAGWRNVACAAVEGGCEAGDDAAKLYRAANLGPDDYYAILASGPTLLTVSIDADKRWRIKDRWSLRDYTPTAQPDSGDRADPPRLFPALYPLGPGDWGVALIRSRSEMYSGGGTSVETADFISLKAIAASAQKAKPVYGSVPFSCGKMIRACFSEQEYKTSKHCHDESTGALRIRYAAAAPGKARHGWTFVWSETDWPQDTPQSKATHETSTIDIPPGGVFDTSNGAFPYCDGGLME